MTEISDKISREWNNSKSNRFEKSNSPPRSPEFIAKSIDESEKQINVLVRSHITLKVEADRDCTTNIHFRVHKESLIRLCLFTPSLHRMACFQSHIFVEKHFCGYNPRWRISKYSESISERSRSELVIFRILLNYSWTFRAFQFFGWRIIGRSRRCFIDPELIVADDSIWV